MLLQMGVWLMSCWLRRMHKKLQQAEQALESTQNQLGSEMGAAAHRALAARDEVNVLRAEAAAAHERQRERRQRLLGVLRGLSQLVRRAAAAARAH